MSDVAALTKEINSNPNNVKIQKSRKSAFESIQDLEFLREVLLGESQEDKVIDNIARGCSREFNRCLSSSSGIESSQEAYNDCYIDKT